jgi:hypothetical protein
MKPEEIEKGMKVSIEELEKSGWKGPHYATGYSLLYFTYQETGIQIAVSPTTSEVIGIMRPNTESAVRAIECKSGCGLM